MATDRPNDSKQTTNATPPPTRSADSAAVAAEPAKRSAFGHTFWMLNSIEMFERLAYFGIRAVVPIYIMQATEPGGLHMTAVHKGIIYAWWAILQSWLPMFTGGIADRYGYKRVLFYSISANAVGYVMMAYLHSYAGFFVSIMVLATGTAFFKPALQGSIAQNLTKQNSSLGWGVFYWVVNIGAMTAPLLATALLGKPHSAEGWRNLFLASAAYTLCNLLLLLTFKDVPSGADKTERLGTVFWRTLENIWPYWYRGGVIDWSRSGPGLVVLLVGFVMVAFNPLGGSTAVRWGVGGPALAVGLILTFWLRGGVFHWQLRLPVFLLIMSCFWMMMYQLWDLHPNFIEDWIDSSDLARAINWDFMREYGDRGLPRVPQQIILTAYNSLLIILLIIPLSWLVRKMRTLSAMVIGMSMATLGVLVAGLSGSGWILILGITFFSFGEMLTGPKKNEYLGLIAPPGKKGLYLGYVNIPIGVGVGIGSLIAGVVYDAYGEKASLALKELASEQEVLARAAQAVDWSDSLDNLPDLIGVPRDEALNVVQQDLGVDRATAIAQLGGSFRYDAGQVRNLALLYVALHPSQRTQVVERMKHLDTVEAKKPSAAHVHLLADLTHVSRVDALDMARDLMNADRDPADALGESAVAAELWRLYGDDEEVLANLALERLAQGTSRVHDAVAAMTFTHGPDDLDGRVEEIEKKLGLERTKAFEALSLARGATAAELHAELAKLDLPAELSDAQRAAVYLASQEHHRFLAVARRDWTKDAAFLRALVDTDPAVRAYVEAHIDEVPWTTQLRSAVVGLFTGGDGDEPTVIDRLAENQNLIIDALDHKDWSPAAEQAMQLLQLNRSELLTRAAAEVNRAPIATTQLLWTKYNPQYHVWIPFAGIGVLAMIALAIFGQMAKRWADMNA